MRRKTQAAMQQAQSRRTHMRQLCKRIAQEFKPEKIILFGSHAYGQPTPESDLDLLVVMQFEGDPLEQAVAMLNWLNVLMPIDLLVRTPEQIRHRLEMGESFMRDIGGVGMGMDGAKLVQRERLVPALLELPGQVECLARVLPGLLAASRQTTDLAEPCDPVGIT